ncbi:hypothetical protein L6164_023214 [Bauhinia variegata]|uniref:Uncharacterized protein n=1 Tax=Bauhinia variegata TaxID=167791 RepID=A0ACB9MIX9_BAUVA|nr:hypothetical protein L6164_023214 [Bauhinia variegata]
MEPTKLITLLLLLSFKFLKTTPKSIIYVGDDCHNSSFSTEQALNNAYQTNLNNVLTLLSSDAATSRGYNHTAEGTGTKDAVYGLYDCRGDVVGRFCQFCVSTATREIPTRCPNRLSVVVWYDFCMFRYSNKNFFGNLSISPSWNFSGSKNISGPSELEKALSFMRSLIGKATVETNQLFAMDVFDLSQNNKRYGLVQCSRDLTNEECSQCLTAMVDKVSQCCGAKQEWLVWAHSCLIKYDDSMFYDLNTQTTSSSPVTETGRSSTSYRAKDFDNSMQTWTLWCEGKSLELMDPTLEKSYIADEVTRCIHIGLLCVQEDAADRPTMSGVVVMLASDTMTLPHPNHPAFSVGRMALGDSSTSKNSKDPSINDVTVSLVAPR